jgi:serine/threonine protein kinase/Flp pilus assembly protein TadD
LKPQEAEVVKTKSSRACPVCGTPFTGELCPVCVLRGALGSEETVSQSVGPTLSRSEFRFEHYEVLSCDDGTPLELGRGAMGVTYKAVDVNLRCAVALKVINARFIGDESARRRFVREARAAASVRHPNVASVFHLGKSNETYFYAMEFVDGQPLDQVIRSSGSLDVKLALEIMTQVASGLSAVHKQNLVHRDVKPSNIMISFEDGGAIAKIIDLGLAKAVAGPLSKTVGSIPGSFAGTPEFASPEQFAGVGVDIRSDLYSLGATLWNMLAGMPPFRGTSAELMYQHLHAALPIGRLDQIPQPIVILLQVLLEKDADSRFQNPTELLNAISAVQRAMNRRRTIRPQELRRASSRGPSSQQKESPEIRAPKRSIAVLPFESLSDNKRDTYFADGVQDEILSNLAKVSRLNVISRTSVMPYRSVGDRDVRSIGEALGVAHVVEGTVRRRGNRVRIAIRLIDARKDKALWYESYDRDLTDVFVIQSEIAETVATKLRARLSPKERQGIGEKPTDDLEAYDLYLQAKQLVTDVPGIRMRDEHDNLLKATKLLQAAILKDPKFARAYCLLAKAHDELYRLDLDDERRTLGDAAVNEASRLRPDLPDVHIASAFHLYRCYRNYERARLQIAIAQRALPNSTDALAAIAYIDRREGRLEESTRALERALDLDPRNPEYLRQLAVNYVCLCRNREFEQIYDRVIRIQAEEKPLLMVEKAFLMLISKADLTSCRAAFKELPASMKHDRRIVSQRFAYALHARDWKMAKEILSDSSNKELYFSEAEALVPRGCLEIWLAQVQGDYPRTRSNFTRAREELYRKVEEYPKDSALLSVLGLIDAALGRAEEAIKEAKYAVEMLPICKDAWEGPCLVYNLAVVYALTNEPSLAFEQLAILFETPGGIAYGELRLDPAWDPLRVDPRFEQLMAQLTPRD